MIRKLENIQQLNDKAKRNEVYKEQLHQNLREYLSWKNSLFKQNNLNKSATGASFSKGDNKKLAQGGALFPMMNMEEMDPEAIMNNTKNTKVDAKQGKTENE